MSIEALWAVRFGQAGNPNLGLNGGVVVLESGRMFGGDTFYAYTGSYEMNGGTVAGQLHAVRHFHQPGTQSAWGTQEPEFDVQFTANPNQDFTVANGTLSKDGVQLGVRLLRVAELP
ncbi:MAG TPA: GrlR family regulatory protein [Sphingomicrobium sp.]|nr:GrlR family regulatory protein [Sphingomicrobium sp.]